MLGRHVLLITAFVAGSCSPLMAIEGPTAAGPIGGTDIRSALLPPPGVYGGTMHLGAATMEFLDGNRNVVPGLEEANLRKAVGGPFVYFVPDVKVFGGSIAVGATVPFGRICGSLFAGQTNQCTTSMGDPYVEVDWARFFGKVRPSRYSGAYPILEGLSVLVGFGVVVPLGGFNSSSPLAQALSMGTNIWDVAPSVALTYTTRPIIADGTELSAKFYWNSYLKNPETDYSTGDVLDVDFALTEHIGRFQVGLAGFYAWQIADDKIGGVVIPPDGRQGDVLQVGGVAAYDMPEHNASLKIKALTAVLASNTPTSWGVVAGWIKKF